MAMLASASSFAATAPVLLPPEGQYVVKWYQSDGVTPALDWEIEVTPTLRSGSPSILDARRAPETSCWSVNVPVGESADVRIRSIAGAQASGWTPTTRVPRADGSYRLKWYQPQGDATVADWDLEITPTRDANAGFVVTALETSERSCWTLDVPVSEPSIARIRPAGGSASSWSGYTVVPEPALGAASAIGAAGLAALTRQRARRRTFSKPSDVCDR